MINETAASVEGLQDHSITLYNNRDLTRAGVRGVHGDLGMQARVRAFGAVLVISVSGSGSEFERRPLRPGLPTLDIIFVQQGQFTYLDGQTWQTSSAPLMVAPSGLPHRVRFVGPWQFVVARIPRQALLPYVPLLSDNVLIYEDLTIPENAMRAFLEQAVASEGEVSPGDSHTVDRTILELAGNMLRARQGQSFEHGSPHKVVLDRGLAIIAKSATDSRLDSASIAAEAGVSLRHLQTVFAEAQTSIAGEIRRERARIARSLLQDPQHDQLSVEQIAQLSGFGSNVSLRRALSEIYNLSPRELRDNRS